VGCSALTIPAIVLLLRSRVREALESGATGSWPTFSGGSGVGLLVLSVYHCAEVDLAADREAGLILSVPNGPSRGSTPGMTASRTRRDHRELSEAGPTDRTGDQCGSPVFFPPTNPPEKEMEIPPMKRATFRPDPVRVGTSLRQKKSRGLDLREFSITFEDGSSTRFQSADLMRAACLKLARGRGRG